MTAGIHQFIVPSETVIGVQDIHYYVIIELFLFQLNICDILQKNLKGI